MTYVCAVLFTGMGVRLQLLVTLAAYQVINTDTGSKLFTLCQQLQTRVAVNKLLTDSLNNASFVYGRQCFVYNMLTSLAPSINM